MLRSGIFSVIALAFGASALSPVTATAQNSGETAIDPRYVAELEELQSDPRVAAALEHIVSLEAQHIRELIEITEIPAPPFNEQARAEHFAGMLREAGLSDVSIDEVGNVIGRRAGKSGKRSIVYNAHLDTVFPEGTDVTVTKDGEKYYAPGIGDNSRGLIVVLGVLRALEHASLQTDADILFVGNVGEEGLGDLRGVKHMFRDGAEPIDVLVAVDGAKQNRIVYGGVGSHRYRVTYRGPGGHSWGAFGNANPHHALGRMMSLFDRNAAPITAEGEKSSYNIGLIGGGTSINSIPFESWAEIDIRSGDQVRIDAIDAILKEAVQQALAEENDGRTEGAELSVEVKRVGTRPAALGNRQWPVVQRLAAAMELYGLTPDYRISSTDANLPIAMGIPALTMSRGGESQDAHSPGEWWRNDDGHLAMQLGLLLLLAEAGYVQ